MATTEHFAKSQEIALVLACLRTHYNRTGPSDVLERARDGVCWPSVLSIARRHGIVPLIYEALPAELADLPEAARTELRSDFQQSAANSFLYAAELIRLSEYLQRQGISALAFKGPTLALLLYGKVSLRTVRDLDILVASDQFSSALAAVQDCGYAPEASAGGRLSLASKTEKHLLLVHQSLGFNLELHWAIAERGFAFELSFERLWASRQNITVLREPVATLSPEDMLIMMCAHGTNHCWGSLKWICDIAQAMAAFSDLDWGRVLARARKLGCERMLLIGTSLARDVCGAALPDVLERGIAYDRSARVMAQETELGLFAWRDSPVDLERTLTFVRSRERLRDRMQILAAFAGPKLKPNARDREWIRLPNSLRALYIPLRLLRLVVMYWKRAIMPMVRSAIEYQPR